MKHQIYRLKDKVDGANLGIVGIEGRYISSWLIICLQILLRWWQTTGSKPLWHFRYAIYTNI